jgi:hypothetical protein
MIKHALIFKFFWIFHDPDEPTERDTHNRNNANEAAVRAAPSGVDDSCPKQRERVVLA